MRSVGTASLFPGACLALLVVNVLAIALFTLLYTVAPSFMEMNTRTKFRELDDAGVINRSAFGQFHPSRGFGDGTDFTYRSTVPVYIAEAPLEGARMGAWAGLLLSLINVVLVLVVVWQGRGLSKASPRPLGSGGS
jgi:hypothetical protein